MIDQQDVQSRLAEFVDAHPVIVHLGAHKTATSYTQRTLQKKRRLLSRQGIEVILPRDLRGQKGSAFAQADLQTRLWAMLDTALAKHTMTRLILSEENVLGSMRINLKTGNLYPNFCENLMSLPAELNHPNVTIFLAVRDYGPYYSSCVTSALRRGHMFDHVDLRQKLLIAPRGWDDVVRDIAARFPQACLQVWRFEDAKQNLDDVHGRMTGVDLRGPQRVIFPSLSQPALNIVSNLAEDLSEEERNAAIDLAEQAYPISKSQPRFSLWTEEEAALLSERYAQDWHNLSQAGPDRILPL